SPISLFPVPSWSKTSKLLGLLATGIRCGSSSQGNEATRRPHLRRANQIFFHGEEKRVKAPKRQKK
ncbi:unnamed protein product, partial [Musa textilis]